MWNLHPFATAMSRRFLELIGIELILYLQALIVSIMFVVCTMVLKGVLQIKKYVRIDINIR